GVIGRDRLLFDLWGDTVNLASRMESSGAPDRIQVSSSTRVALGDRCAFEEREVDVKGFGRLPAYLFTGSSPRSTVSERSERLALSVSGSPTQNTSSVKPHSSR